MITVIEVTNTNIDQVHADLVQAYSGVGVLCPLENLAPHPSKRQIQTHLDNPETRILACYEDSEFLLMELFENDGLRAAWGPKDPVRVPLCTEPLVDFWAAEGKRYLIDTGTPGWVTRQYFEDNLAQGNQDAYDVEFNNYNLHDDEEWTVSLWRHTDGSIRWEVLVK